MSGAMPWALLVALCGRTGWRAATRYSPYGFIVIIIVIIICIFCMEVALLPARRITKRPAQQVCPKSLMEQQCTFFSFLMVIHFQLF